MINLLKIKKLENINTLGTKELKGYINIGGDDEYTDYAKRVLKAKRRK
jgi:hypothetical protein